MGHLVNGGWVLALNLARQLLALAFVMLLVRIYQKDAVGQFQFVIAAIGLAGIFTLSGFGQAVVQSVARGHPGTFGRAQRWRLAGSLIGAGALIGYGLIFAEDHSMRNAIVVAGLLFPVAQGLGGWTDFQAGEGKFRLNALWQGAAYLLAYGGMMLALALQSPGIVELVAVMQAGLGAINLLAMWRIMGRVPRDASPEPGALRYGLEASAYGAVNLVGNQVDKVLIFAIFSPAALAIFVIAERVPEILKNYLQSIRTVLVPSFSRKRTYTRALHRKIALVSAAISLGVLVIIFAVLPWALPLAFTEAYGEAVFYSQLLCGTLILGQVAQTRYLFIISRFDAVAMRNVTMISNLVRIAASLVLVPLFGILGAVASTALYRLSTAVVVSLMMQRYRLSEGSV